MSSRTQRLVEERCQAYFRFHGCQSNPFSQRGVLTQQEDAQGASMQTQSVNVTKRVDSERNLQI